ncbi:CDP-glycerol glycerophosphotransferase family protein [Terribacillus saccharophilus]|uniref:CDP-glycerol glycerophosphotransferase family protein n=1 Tax=Terribacillus saccharophilus TaxID=361277 RepID=UPI002DCED797|nr:CDP-glycerol glycerophosphotransferase family protein [Terribacillus saccharophilus]
MKNLIKRNIQRVFKLAFLIVSKLPTKKDVIVFESFLGKQYSDNPKAIYLFMKEHYPQFKYYWSIAGSKANYYIKEDIDVLKRFSFKWFLTMPRAKVWVSNSRLPLWFYKNKNTIYVQTWHGTPLKKLATDMDEVLMPGTSTEKYKENFVNEAKRWNALISPNAYSTKIFKRAFSYNGTLLETGYPRNDKLYNENNSNVITRLKKENNLPLDKKIILYAPTWRDNKYHEKGKYKFDLELDLDKLKEEISDDYIVILRMHYLIADKINVEPYKGFVYNFSDYKDINDLYLIADTLITDYSSVFFDYANLKRPMIFYAYDIVEYRDKLRGFYFNFEDKAPGPLVFDTQELIDQIKLIDNGQFDYDKIHNFADTYCYLETGDSSEKAAAYIYSKLV